MKTISLNGEWELYFFEQGTKDISSPGELKGLEKICATVPGNAELDLMKCGILPEDIYRGMNIKEVEKFENFEWWYKKEFEVLKEFEGKEVVLKFGAVDCLAEYWLNGEKIGESDNMFIPIEFDVSKKLVFGEKNTVAVRIRSVVLEAYKSEAPMLTVATGWDIHHVESVGIRKAPHSFGWDIMPRALTVGLWRSVDLCIKDDYEFEQLFCFCEHSSKTLAKLRICYDLKMPVCTEGCYIEAEGFCKDSKFYSRAKMYFKAGALEIEFENPKLWWPYGYGEANLYSVEVRVIKDGEVVAKKGFNTGIRQVRLERTDTTDGINGCFAFYINNVPVMCKGSNWVPLDAFHSRDAERYERALELVSDIGCNILRCWGGNVYEDECFFDYCDKHGIMVWQDFAMACNSYPQNEEFYQKIQKEAKSVIKSLRNHPSIILWSGDNECDSLYFYHNADPGKNKITRDILPSAVFANDMMRPYLESSPYISPQIAKQKDDRFAPEKHLWGARDYYKSSFYANPTVHFVSETGYHGCPSPKSIKKFIDEDCLWPVFNEQWILHSSDQRGNPARVKLMADQIKQLFGYMPDNLEEFSFASQISQAEAKKFFIENIRVNRETKSGIIWWNLLDGWPQMSDAVVDYYYEKKLAYDFIKRSQQPFAIMCGELCDWEIPVVAANDTLCEVLGEFKVTNAEDGAQLLHGDFKVEANSNALLGKIPVFYSDKGMFLIEWTIGEKRFVNHYLYGMPAFDINDYKRWLEKIK